MSNLKSWILEQSDGEPVLAVIISPGDNDICPVCKNYVFSWEANCPDCGTLVDKFKFLNIPVLTWEEALPELEKEFNSGYGISGCPAIYAYTKTWVIFVSTYDGSTSIKRIPRNPTANINPIMPGGG
jgi:WD40 repeat protein